MLVRRKERRGKHLFCCCSSSIELLLLEWVLFDLSHHCIILLHLWHSTPVSSSLSLDRFDGVSLFSLAANRIQIACTLLLTSITFRWTVNRSLVSATTLWTRLGHVVFSLFLADDLVFDIDG